MKTLTRYIGREVLGAILLIFMALIMLFAFFGSANHEHQAAVVRRSLHPPRPVPALAH